MLIMIYKYLDKAPQFAVPFEGWVADSARVIGDVYLGHKANVWFGAVIRGDNERINIGNCTNVQENAVIHTDAGIEVNIEGSHAEELHRPGKETRHSYFQIFLRLREYLIREKAHCFPSK